jgi:hypothetical protein
MAADASEHVPDRLKAEEAAAEAEFLAGGVNPDETGATADGVTDPDPTPATDPAPDAQPPQGDTATPADDGHPATAQGEEGDLSTRLAAAEERARIAEQQYRTLLGKYNAEVPREQHRTADLQQEITALKAEIATLKTGIPADKANAKPAATKEAEIPSATDPANPYGLTDEEREYGNEMIGMAEKIAKKIIEREVGDIRGKTETVSKELAQRKQEGFYSELDGLAPDWRTLNSDPGFHAFCQEVEPNSGLLWQQIIDDGQDAMSAFRVSNVFNAFRQKAGGTKPAPKSAAVTPVDAQVAPDAAPSPAPGGKKVYTLKEYDALMNNIIHGRYTDEKARKIEAELDAAINEGRVKG